MTEESKQPRMPHISRMPAWRRKSLVYHGIMTSLVERNGCRSNEIAEVVTVTNAEVMYCAEQINVVHPGYLKLTQIEVEGPLVLTELGLKLIKTDPKEHCEADGGVLLPKFVDLFSIWFLVSGLSNKWIDLIFKDGEIQVIPGQKSQELSFSIYIASEISLGFLVTGHSKRLALNHGLVIPDKKMSAYLIERGPNFPTDRIEVSRTWFCMMNREKVLETQGQSSNFRK